MVLKSRGFVRVTIGASSIALPLAHHRRHSRLGRNYARLTSSTGSPPEVSHYFALIASVKDYPLRNQADDRG
jgi:hypothetical protein